MSRGPIKVFSGTIKDGVECPPVIQVKRKGNGINLILLRKMEVGQSVWEIPRKKMLSLRHTAGQANIKLKVRKLPSGRYAVFKIL